MADKKFTHKVGMDGLLDFDPINGILKYGSYEVFAKDVGVDPLRHEVTFEDYLKVARPGPVGVATNSMIPLTGQERENLFASFESDLASGAFRPAAKRQGFVPLPGDLQPDSFELVRDTAFSFGPKTKPTDVRNIQRLGPDSFSVETYDFPTNNADLINKIGERAQGLKYQGDDAALLQNQSDAKARRMGRASTVLSSSAATTVNA